MACLLQLCHHVGGSSAVLPHVAAQNLTVIAQATAACNWAHCTLNGTSMLTYQQWAIHRSFNNTALYSREHDERENDLQVCCPFNRKNNSLRVLCRQVAVEDIIADGRLRLAVQPVFDETQLAAALQVTRSPVHVNGMLLEHLLDRAGQ